MFKWLKNFGMRYQPLDPPGLKFFVIVINLLLSFAAGLVLFVLGGLALVAPWNFLATLLLGYVIVVLINKLSRGDFDN